MPIPRSDKPKRDSTYTFAFHRNLLLRFAEHVALQDVILVVQDWGGTLGLTLPVDSSFRANFQRLIVMNAALPVGEPLSPHYYEWRSLVRSTPDPPVGRWMRTAAPELTDLEMAAYDAPYPDARCKAGPRRLSRAGHSSRRRSLRPRGRRPGGSPRRPPSIW